MPADSRPAVTPKLILGASAILAGVLLTLDNLDLAETSWLFRYWALAPLCIGLVVAAQAHEGNGRAGGALLAFFGLWLLLDNLQIISVSLWEMFWPLVLIVAGVALLRQTRRRRTREPTPSADSIELFALMAGVKRKSTAGRFRHASINAMWGGCDLDLRQATIPPGESASIEVFALMGGHNILVPEGWQTDVRTFPIMGGIDDKTALPPNDDAPRLIIDGFVMMGGLVIKN